MISLEEADGSVEVLDRILRSRSHVRILRALFAADPSVNWTARALGKAARVSHVQAVRTLTELERAGVVAMERQDGYSLCRLNEDHLLLPMLMAAFDEEMHVLEKLHAFVRVEARRQGLLAGVSIERGVGGAWEILLVARKRLAGEDEMWARRVGAEARRRSGLDIRVRLRTPEVVAAERFARALER